MPTPLDASRLLAQLQALREAQGLSQQDVARVIGCHQSQVSKWENGTAAPSLVEAERYAEAVGMRLSGLEPIA